LERTIKKSSNYLIIIPAYNEEAAIEKVVSRAKKYADLCVIDDNSRDATPEILKRFDDIHVIRHERNTHIPGGLLDGMRYAVEHGYEYGIAMDAGLSHNPDEIPKFIQYEHADLVIGTREIKYHVPLFRQLLSVTGGFIYNICLDFPRSVWKERYFKDVTSGFRRYSNKAMQLIISKQIQSRSFDILFETVMYVYRSGLTISEVPITYTFSNSSLNSKVVKDCLNMCFRALVERKK
jgi:dolichol-phosphate mannosyltransferase